MPRDRPNQRHRPRALLQRLLKVAPPCLAFLWLTTPVVWASSIQTIDLRDGITEEKLAQYHAAVLGDTDSQSSARLIKLLVSANEGFDAGWLRVPKQRRFLRVNVVIYTFRGQQITAPIRVNLFELDTRSIKHINLEVSLR